MSGSGPQKHLFQLDPKYIRNISLIADASYGRILVAARDFERGDVIFAESPLLMWSSSSSSDSSSSSSMSPSVDCNYDSVESAGGPQNCDDGIDESIRMDYNYIKAFTLLTKEYQDDVLNFHCPDFKNNNVDSYLLEYSSKYYYRKMIVDMFVSMGYFKSLDKDTIMRLLLINDSNAHTFTGFNGSWGHGSKAALFKMGSKMEHSCKPNVTYSSRNKVNKLVYTASDSIAAGSRLSFTYIESYKLSRKQRIELLRSSFYFVCECVRCYNIQYDDSRPICCSSCSNGVSYFLGKKSNNKDETAISSKISTSFVDISLVELGDEGDTSELVCLSCAATSSEKRKGEKRMREKGMEKKYNSYVELWTECQPTDIFKVKPVDLENLVVNALKSLHLTHYLVGNILSLCAAVYAAHYEQLSRTIDESIPVYAISSAIGYKFEGVDILREKSLKYTILQLKAMECLIAGCTVSHAGICDDQLLFPHVPSTEAAHLALFCFQDAAFLDVKAARKGAGSLSGSLAARYYGCVRSHYGEHDEDVVAMESLMNKL